MADPKTAYWTFAWLNMGVIVVLAWLARSLVQRSDVRGHRRLMLGASTLVVLFVLSYVGKVALLGKEELGTWGLEHRIALWVHEACVAVMLGGGITALVHAYRTGLAPGSPRSGSLAPDREARGRRLHRAAGLTSVISATAALVTAGYVLYGMYMRVGAAG